MGQAAYHCGDQADHAQLPSQFFCSLPTGQPAFLGGSSSPWLRRQPFARMLSEGTSPTEPMPMSRIWFNLFSLLWIWGVAWLSGIKREICTGCCAIKKRKFNQGSCFPVTVHSCLQSLVLISRAPPGLRFMWSCLLEDLGVSCLLSAIVSSPVLLIL